MHGAHPLHHSHHWKGGGGENGGQGGLGRHDVHPWQGGWQDQKQISAQPPSALLAQNCVQIHDGNGAPSSIEAVWSDAGGCGYRPQCREEVEIHDSLEDGESIEGGIGDG